MTKQITQENVTLQQQLQAETAKKEKAEGKCKELTKKLESEDEEVKKLRNEQLWFRQHGDVVS